MADALLPQAHVNILTTGGDADLSQSWLSVVLNYPAEDAQDAQTFINIPLTTGNPAELSQLFTNIVVRGKIDNPKVRAWTFKLDGHAFYVLRLGEDQTLVYDVMTEQWMEWADFNSSIWRAQCGTNWIGGQALAATFGSDIVVGDDNFGLLWFLNPEQPYDQHPDEDAATQELYFERITMGQVAMTGREVMPCYSFWLTTDMGDPAYLGADVLLEISDDAGKTFNNMGYVVVSEAVNSPEIAWYSLGQIAAPGRLFKITDDGAVARIDSADMNDGE